MVLMILVSPCRSYFWKRLFFIPFDPCRKISLFKMIVISQGPRETFRVAFCPRFSSDASKLMGGWKRREPDCFLAASSSPLPRPPLPLLQLLLLLFLTSPSPPPPPLPLLLFLLLLLFLSSSSSSSYSSSSPTPLPVPLLLLRFSFLLPFLKERLRSLLTKAGQDSFVSSAQRPPAPTASRGCVSWVFE